MAGVLVPDALWKLIYTAKALIAVAAERGSATALDRSQRFELRHR